MFPETRTRAQQELDLQLRQGMAAVMPDTSSKHGYQAESKPGVLPIISSFLDRQGGHVDAGPVAYHDSAGDDPGLAAFNTLALLTAHMPTAAVV